MANQRVPADMIKGTVFSTNNFGDLRIENYNNALDVQVTFCATNYSCSARASNIRRGFVRDPYKPFVAGVGFTGEGKYKKTRHGIYKKAYGVWAGMIKRCYSKESLKLHPTYQNCTVCKDWHNFQNFAVWFENHYKPGKHLDKDILIEGNTEYSAKTCKFVTQEENSVKAAARYFVLTDPQGVQHKVYNLEAFCRSNNLHSSSLRKVRAGDRKSTKGWKLHSYGQLAA